MCNFAWEIILRQRDLQKRNFNEFLEDPQVRILRLNLLFLSERDKELFDNNLKAAGLKVEGFISGEDLVVKKE